MLFLLVSLPLAETYMLGIWSVTVYAPNTGNVCMYVRMYACLSGVHTYVRMYACLSGVEPLFMPA